MMEVALPQIPPNMYSPAFPLSREVLKQSLTVAAFWATPVRNRQISYS